MRSLRRIAVAFACTLIATMAIGLVSFAGQAYAYFYAGGVSCNGVVMCSSSAASAYTSAPGLTATIVLNGFMTSNSTGQTIAKADSAEGSNFAYAGISAVSGYTMDYANAYFGTEEYGTAVAKTASP